MDYHTHVLFISSSQTLAQTSADAASIGTRGDAFPCPPSRQLPKRGSQVKALPLSSRREPTYPRLIVPLRRAPRSPLPSASHSPPASRPPTEAHLSLRCCASYVLSHTNPSGSSQHVWLQRLRSGIIRRVALGARPLTPRRPALVMGMGIVSPSRLATSQDAPRAKRGHVARTRPPLPPGNRVPAVADPRPASSTAPLPPCAIVHISRRLS